MGLLCKNTEKRKEIYSIFLYGHHEMHYNYITGFSQTGVHERTAGGLWGIDAGID